jgi:hypothetical protein
MSFSATGVTQAPPNAISMAISATVATTQDDLVSMEAEGDCSMKKNPADDSLLQGAGNLTTCKRAGANP